jgi:hypothetical protein
MITSVRRGHFNDSNIFFNFSPKVFIIELVKFWLYNHVFHKIGGDKWSPNAFIILLDFSRLKIPHIFTLLCYRSILLFLHCIFHIIWRHYADSSEFFPSWCVIITRLVSFYFENTQKPWKVVAAPPARMRFLIWGVSFVQLLSHNTHTARADGKTVSFGWHFMQNEEQRNS